MSNNQPQNQNQAPNQNQVQGDDEPILDRLPFNIINQQNPGGLNQQQQLNQNIPVNNQAQPEVSFLDSLTPSEVVDIGSFFIPSLVYTIAILIGLTATKTLCSESFGIMLKIMIGINLVCMTRAIYHLLMISIKQSHSEFGKGSINISMYILYSLYYMGTIACYAIYSNRPDNCFLSKENYFLLFI